MLIKGTVLQNRYQIIHHIGGGGMGDVYLATDTRLGNPVVVKENRGGDPQLFYTEAKILSTLRHHNMPRVSDYFTEQNQSQFLVMDYIAGQNLEQIVQTRGMLREQDALAWLNQILDAVKYLHANRIIHRDIKPQNIIITQQGVAMLVDFGIAKIMTSGRPTISAAHGIGSPGYASLEQYYGGTDERSDIYALGATLYFALTALAPPSAPERGNGVPLQSICALNASVPAHVEQAIVIATAVVTAQRFSTIDQFQNALHTPMGTSPAQPPRATWVTPTAPATSRALTWVWLASGMGALLLVVVVLIGVTSPLLRVTPTQSQSTVATAQSFLPATPTRVLPTATLEPGWKLSVIASDKFAIASPPSWDIKTLTPANLAAQLDEIAKKNPQLAASLKGQSSEYVTKIKFIGYETSPNVVREGFMPNVNVIHDVEKTEMTYDEGIKGWEKELAAYKPSIRKVRGAAGEMVEIKFTMPLKLANNQAVNLASAQYLILRGRDSYAISCVALDKQAAAYMPLCEKIGLSFRWVN